MKYRRFGKTEIRMPVITCGGMRFQQTWDDKGWDEVEKENQKNLEACIHRAFELGINHFETARGYGTSEMQLGKVLPELPRDKIIVQTKVTPRDDVDDFIKQVERSLELLKLDYVDLFSIHGISDRETYDQTFRAGGCIEAAKKMQDKGYFRHLGFSTHGPSDVIMDTIKTGEFAYMNFHYYYIFQDNYECLLEAEKRDMGILIISPNDKGGKLYEPSQKIVDLCKPISPMMYNDLYCLSHPAIHTLSTGAAKTTDFDEHVKALSYYDTIEDTITSIKKILDDEHDKNGRNGLYKIFLKDLPDWSKIPGEVNVKKIIWLRWLCDAFDLVEYGKMRYNLLGNGGHWFPGQKYDPEKKGDLVSFFKDNPDQEELLAIIEETHDMLNGEDKKRLSESESK